MANSNRPIVASTKVLSLLERLHKQSQTQENTLSMYTFWISYLIRSFLGGRAWSANQDNYMRDKFIALEPEKCEFIYLLARSTGARNIVEAGTSFGVSTIYLALASGQNAGATPETRHARVIATEKEPSKARQAKEHWKLAGDEVEPWITLLEGDLLEKLPEELNRTGLIDLLLLDIWIPLAWPTLQIVKPRLRPGAVVIADMTAIAKQPYKEFLEYLYDPCNGFKAVTTPFSGGLELAVYLPEGH